MSESHTPAFVHATQQAQAVFTAHQGSATPPTVDQARDQLNVALRTKDLNHPEIFAALGAISGDIANEVQNYGSIRKVPAAATPNLRNSMYLTSDAVRLLPKAGVSLSPEESSTLKSYAGELNAGTRYIPNWVKVSVAVALGLGTMVGWKRIVVTVGEKIGKQHLTYAEGASAELVAAGTIGLAEAYGLPVSTTHILSSGVAGAMAANGSGLQMSTVRNMALAWVLTLPAAITLAAVLYFILRHVF
jgi:inorganic phosphate transporter, PiT family